MSSFPVTALCHFYYIIIVFLLLKLLFLPFSFLFLFSLLRCFPFLFLFVLSLVLSFLSLLFSFPFLFFLFLVLVLVFFSLFLWIGLDENSSRDFRKNLFRSKNETRTDIHLDLVRHLELDLREEGQVGVHQGVVDEDPAGVDLRKGDFASVVGILSGSVEDVGLDRRAMYRVEKSFKIRFDFDAIHEDLEKSSVVFYYSFYQNTNFSSSKCGELSVIARLMFYVKLCYF
jgi:energy-coupling factor transporter transmembrane protein EcfT